MVLDNITIARYTYTLTASHRPYTLVLNTNVEHGDTYSVRGIVDKTDGDIETNRTGEI